MLRLFNYLGWLKWPSLALVSAVPAIAYPYWLPKPVAMARQADVTLGSRRFTAYAMRQRDGYILFSLRAAEGARAKPVRLIEGQWAGSTRDNDDIWYEGEPEYGAAIIALPPPPADATGLRLYLQTGDRRESAGTVPMPSALPEG